MTLRILIITTMFLANIGISKTGYRDTIKSGDTLYISGQLSTTTAGNVIKGDVYLQTTNALSLIEHHLKGNGFQKSNLVLCTVYLTDYRHGDEMNRAFGEFFKKIPWPTRTVVGGVQLWKGLDVEITCTAKKM